MRVVKVLFVKFFLFNVFSRFLILFLICMFVRKIIFLYEVEKLIVWINSFLVKLLVIFLMIFLGFFLLFILKIFISDYCVFFFF